MSVLQSQPALSISTNECKKTFLTSEINQMKQTKQIYLEILTELKSILKETSVLTKRTECSILTAPQKRLQQSQQQSSVQTSIQSAEFSSQQPAPTIKNITNLQQTYQLQSQIQQFTTTLQQKIRDYCCSQISQNIVKYLDIEKQQQHFHPKVIQSLSAFIKNHEKIITQREKQLQEIEDLKYLKAGQKDKENHRMSSKKKVDSDRYEIEKDRQTTQKTISSFDFNRRVLQVAKKEITFLKLKKRKLEMEVQERKKLKNIQKTITNCQKSQIIQKTKKLDEPMHQSTSAGISEEFNFKKLPGLKNNSALKQAFLSNKPVKNDISAFEKIVMVYQKDRFLNCLMQQKITKLKEKISTQKYQNTSLKEKTTQLEKEIEKLDWHKVCDSTFIGVQNKKLDKMLQLSILDRTELVPCDEMSVEYSKMSINQSMIRRY